jgi:C4-dicarboxylate-specific signal transduction histidine kinase
MQQVPLSQIIEDTLSLCQERFRVNMVELRARGSDAVVECRSIQIAQIILNLLNNAYDAIQSCEEKWIELTYRVESNKVAIVVRDSGEGISASIQQKIMQPFFTTKEIGQGTGLGLSIAKGIVEDNGGSLKYQLIDGHTAFVLEFPQNQSMRLQKDSA